MPINFTFGQNFGRAYENALQRNDQRSAQEALQQLRRDQHRLAMDRFNEQVRANMEADSDRDRAYNASLVTLEDGRQVSTGVANYQLARDEMDRSAENAVDLNIGEIFPGIPGGSDLMIRGASPNAALNALGIGASIANRRTSAAANPDLSQDERNRLVLSQMLGDMSVSDLNAFRDRISSSAAGSFGSPPSPSQAANAQILLNLINAAIARRQQRARDVTYQPPGALPNQ